MFTTNGIGPKIYWSGSSIKKINQFKFEQLND